MHNLNESLYSGDLRDLVSHIFEIDSYTSKLGSDGDIVVVSFTVTDKEPADDLVNFIERGYDFVLDADSAQHETKDGYYHVFVEIERTRRVPEQIMEILYGVGKLTGIKDFRFRYYKSFKSIGATEETIKTEVPTSKIDYNIAIKENSLNNFSNFFNRSYLETIDVDDQNITFQKKYSEPLRLKILDAGPTEQVYENLQGRLMIESQAIAECIYLTKYLGNYNITKVGNDFVFENDGFAVVFRR